MPIRRLTVPLLASLLAATTFLAAPASVPASADGVAPAVRATQATQATRATRATKAKLRYVALGDSYSAASGVLPLDPTAFVGCLRSTRNYPHVIASRIGARLTDVTCGAAETGDYTSAQYPGVPAQVKALSRGTQLVTMTIGGNDSGVFINAILQCGAAGVSTLGTGSPCRDRYGASFERTVRKKTYPSLVKALRKVHAKAPRARVAIIGYPDILPRRKGCFPTMPVATGDVPYLRSLQGALNTAVRRAAEATDTVYVDVPKASHGHDACKPIGTRWVEPVLLGTNPVIVHPNALGERKIAQVTMRRLHLR